MYNSNTEESTFINPNNKSREKHVFRQGSFLRPS